MISPLENFILSSERYGNKDDISLYFKLRLSNIINAISVAKKLNENDIVLLV